MTSVDYADDLLRQLQAQRRIPLRSLPRHLGGALAARMATGQRPEPMPPKWESGESRSVLGYLALYQRILAGTLPEGSTAAEKFRDALRLALSEALHRDIAELRFRHAPAAAQGSPVAAPASTFLADILSERQNEGSLSSRRYTVLLRSLKLAGQLPEHEGQAPASFLKPLNLEALSAFEADNPVEQHLTFARFARLLAAGVLTGMQVRVLLDPGLDIASDEDVVTPSELDAYRQKAIFRLAVLVAVRDIAYEDRPLLKIAADPLLDAAAFAHLKAADSAYRKDPAKALDAVNKKDPAALKIAESKFAVRLLQAQGIGPISGACSLIGALRGLRFLVETSSLDASPDSARAFLWLKLHGERTKGDPERLMRLEDDTAKSLADCLDAMWGRKVGVKGARV